MKKKTLRQVIDESLMREGKAEAAADAEIAKTLQTLSQQFQKKSQAEAQEQPVQQAPAQQTPAAAPAQPAASVETKESKKKKAKKTVEEPKEEI